MPETQKPFTPPRIRNIDEVLRELRGYPGMPNQAHLTTYKVSLTEERYFPSEAMEKEKNIATLMDMMMDEDFLERCLNVRKSFYIRSKDTPQEIIGTLENLGDRDLSVHFKIDRKEGTLIRISKEEFNMLNPTERGVLTIASEGIKVVGLMRMHYAYSTSSPGWFVSDLFSKDEVPLQAAFIESTD